MIYLNCSCIVYKTSVFPVVNFYLYERRQILLFVKFYLGGEEKSVVAEM